MTGSFRWGVPGMGMQLEGDQSLIAREETRHKFTYIDLAANRARPEKLTMHLIANTNCSVLHT